MGNHYHLLVETPEPNLSRGMRRLNGVYTQAFNRRYGLVGHLFQGRYKGIIVDRDSYLLELCRYVVLNPVRAGLVETPDTWAWSSYSATAGVAPAPAWLAANEILHLFHKNTSAARGAYTRFVAQGAGSASPWEGLAGQIFLGSDAFLERMQELAANQPAGEVPEAQRRPARPDRESVIRAVAEIYNVAPEDVLDRASGPAFKAAVYLLRRVVNLSLAEVAQLAFVSRSRVLQIQSELESGIGEERLEMVLRTIK